jgi:hypothetical protein
VDFHYRHKKPREEWEAFEKAEAAWSVREENKNYPQKALFAFRG